MRHIAVWLFLIPGCNAGLELNQPNDSATAQDAATVFDGPTATDGPIATDGPAGADGPGPAATLSFGPAKSFSADNTPYGVVVADFTRDGRLDVAVTNYGSSDVSVLAGDGNGGLGQPTNTTVGTLPTAIATADFNNDGTPDLVVSDGKFGDSPPTNDIYGLLGNGDGTFSVKIYSQPSFAGDKVACPAAATGEFDKDTHPDAIVLCQGSTHNAGLTYLAGSSTGAFAPAVVGVGVVPTMGVNVMVVSDFNHDGRLDVVAQDKIMLGNGDGSFQSAMPTGLYIDRGGVAADFDGDGMPDVVYSDSQHVFFAKGTGLGTFASPSQLTTGTNAYPFAMATADFNTDGRLDIVVVDYSAHTMMVLIGNGDGTFNLSGSFNAGTGMPTSVAVGDLDRDGRPDVAVADQNMVWILLNTSH